MKNKGILTIFVLTFMFFGFIGNVSADQLKVYDVSESDCKNQLNGTWNSSDNSCTYNYTVKNPEGSNVQTLTARDVSESECKDKLHGTWDSNTNVCTYKKVINTAATNNYNGNSNVQIGFKCGDPDVNNILGVVKRIYNFMRFTTPVILIILGSVDFFKATISNGDDIEKNKKKFLNRLVIAVIIFLLLSVFQLVTNILESSGVSDSNSWVSCWNSL